MNISYLVFVLCATFGLIILALLALILVIDHYYQKRNKRITKAFAEHEQDYWKLRVLIAKTPMHYADRYALRQTLERWRRTR